MILRFALLGLVQGLTEFLPVSSSGHLVLAERLLGLDPPGVLLEALLHLATLAAILVAFRADVAALFRALTPRGSLAHRKEIGMILAGTVPIVFLGLLLRERIDALFSSLAVVSGGLIATGSALVLSSVLARPRRRNVRFGDALGIGVAQASALLPGLSRSGVTISAALLLGIAPERAARFSFLLAMPAILGGGLLSLWQGMRQGAFAAIDGWGYAVGVAVAFGVGWIAIRALLAVVARGKLWAFGGYCLALGIAVAVLR